MDKKGILGLETAKAFIVIVLIVSVLVVAGIFLMNELATNNLSDIKQPTVQFFNLTSEDGDTCGNGTGCFVTGTRSGLDNCQLTLTSVFNTSIDNQTDTTGGNWTIVGCFINGSSASANFSNAGWTMTGTYDFTKDDQIEDTMGNVTEGFLNFFTNASSWFSLLAIVVIIMIIAIVIVTVNRFGSVAGGGFRDSEGASGQL